MKPTVPMLLLATLLLIAACSPAAPTVNATISGIGALVLTPQDVQQLGLTSSGCQIERYETGPYSPLSQYGMCNYTIAGTNTTEIIVELKSFTNENDLNGSYQYDSSHLYGASGLLSENTYGDQSRFRVNSADDYGGQYNTPGIFYYHLWITKDTYLIHITSKGIESDKEYLAKMGRRFLEKFAPANAGIANPASVYCKAQGGTPEIIDTAQGRRGNCLLANGQVCDEWEYFRGTCDPTLPSKNCPLLTTPGPEFCVNGTIVPGAKDSRGCPEAPTCRRT